MLSKFRVRHYKSLYDTEINLEPLTVLIGPNGSGKSNICEALAVISNFIQKILANDNNTANVMVLFSQSLQAVSKNSQSIESKFWHGELNYLFFSIYAKDESIKQRNFSLGFEYQNQTIKVNFNEKFDTLLKHNTDLKNALLQMNFSKSILKKSISKVEIYDFAPSDLSNQVVNPDVINMNRTGEGIAYALVDILHANRQSFDELEARLTKLVPNIARISLPRKNQSFELELIDKYSEHHIPASDISDGTLRILAFLVALYQEDTPSIICFEEIENGVHPWLLHKMVELLKIVSTEGINGNPVQVLITTHSPLLLNYVEPHQVRAVELDSEGKTQVHALPTNSARFQKSLEAYDDELGELWFTNVFGGNPV